MWVWIPASYTGWTFFTYLLVVKIVMCVWKDENKQKRGRGWPFLKKYTPHNWYTEAHSISVKIILNQGLLTQLRFQITYTERRFKSRLLIRHCYLDVTYLPEYFSSKSENCLIMLQQLPYVENIHLLRSMLTEFFGGNLDLPKTK